MTDQIVITNNGTEVLRITTIQLLVHFFRQGFIVNRPQPDDDIKFHIIDDKGDVRWYQIELPKKKIAK